MKAVVFFDLCSLGGGIVCLGISAYLWRAFLNKGVDTVKRFSLAFLFLGLAFGVLSLPGTVLFDSTLIQIDFILTDIFFFGGICFFIPPALSFSERTFSLKKPAPLVITSGVAVYILLNVLFFAPAVPIAKKGVIFYWTSGTPLIQGMTHGFFCAVGLSMPVLFFKESRDLRKAALKRTIFLIISGLLISSAGFIFWFFPFFYFTPFLLAISGIGGFLGTIIGIMTTFLFKESKPLEENASGNESKVAIKKKIGF